MNKKYNRKIRLLNTIFVFIIIFILFFTIFTNAKLTYQSKSDSRNIKHKKIITLKELPYEILPKTTKVSFLNNDLSIFSADRSIIPKDIFPIQKNPKITSFKESIIVLSETKTNNSSKSMISASYSDDNGDSWSDILTISDVNTNFSYPTIDFTGDLEMQGYGSHKIDKKTGMQAIFSYPNIIDPSKPYVGSTIDFDRNGWFSGLVLNWNPDDWLNITDLSVAGFKHGSDVSPFKNFHGLVAWSGHHKTLGWSYFLVCETDENLDKGYKILWKGSFNNTIYNMDIDIDLSNGWQYDTWEIKNKTTNKHEIILDTLKIEPDNPTWFNNKDNYGPSHVFVDYTNPSIKATNGYVYLVCEKNDDIYLHYSNDLGNSFKTKKITDTLNIESNPDVTATGKIVTISYIRNNSIYTVHSEDACETFKEESRINDEENFVSSEYHSTDIDKNYVVFENTYYNSTIFFNNLNISVPRIKLENFSSGIGLSFDIVNSGDSDIDKFFINTRLDGGLILNKKIDVNISKTIRPGGIQNIRLKPIIGIGRTNLTITVNTDYTEPVELKRDLFVFLFYSFVT